MGHYFDPILVNSSKFFAIKIFSLLTSDQMKETKSALKIMKQKLGIEKFENKDEKTRARNAASISIEKLPTSIAQVLEEAISVSISQEEKRAKKISRCSFEEEIDTYILAKMNGINWFKSLEKNLEKYQTLKKIYIA